MVLTRIEADISAAYDGVFNLKNSLTAWPTYVEHGTDEFLKRELPGVDFRGAHDIRLERLRRGEAALRDRHNLRCPLTWAGILTAIDIAIALIALPFVPILACSVACSRIVTGITLLLAVACLALYGRVVRGVIRGL